MISSLVKIIMVRIFFVFCLLINVIKPNYMHNKNSNHGNTIKTVTTVTMVTEIVRSYTQYIPSLPTINNTQFFFYID